MNIARYEKRIWGWLIDEFISLMAGSACLVLMIIFGRTGGSLFLWILLAISGDYFFYVLVTAVTMHLSQGSTIGMLIVGIKSYHPDGERLKARECWLKALLTGIIAMDIINSIYMLVVHTERSAFDRLTNTLVIDARHREI
jgi:uncharacterized RDD family membrane protein YckC